MEGLIPTTARYARIEARHQGPPIAAVLIDTDTDTGRQELLIGIEPDTGVLTATLCGEDLEAMGRSPVVLTTISAHTTTAATTVAMTGYDTTADRCRQLEAAVSVAWTIGDTGPDSLDVAGTALLTDLDCGHLTVFRAVRSHPFNRLHLTADRSHPCGPAPDADLLPVPSPPEESQLLAS